MLTYHRLFLLLFLSLVVGQAPIQAQEASAVARPHILGVAQVTFYVHDIKVSRKFYHDFLGFEESDSDPSQAVFYGLEMLGDFPGDGIFMHDLRPAADAGKGDLQVGLQLPWRDMVV